jgi:hypothetical protein
MPSLHSHRHAPYLLTTRHRVAASSLLLATVVSTFCLPLSLRDECIQARRHSPPRPRTIVRAVFVQNAGTGMLAGPAALQREFARAALPARGPRGHCSMRNHEPTAATCERAIHTPPPPDGDRLAGPGRRPQPVRFNRRPYTRSRPQTGRATPAVQKMQNVP